MRKPAYNQYEGRAVARLYLEMAQAQIDGRKINKAQMIRELQETVDRSRGSIEAKLMNFSAVLEAIYWKLDGTKSHFLAWNWLALLEDGHVKGYKPAPNYQKEMERWLIEAATSEYDSYQGITNLHQTWHDRDEYSTTWIEHERDQLRHMIGGYYV